MDGMRKVLGIVTAIVLAGAAFTGGWNPPASAATKSAPKTFMIGMVTDQGSINDQSFNQSAWQGLTRFAKETSGVKVKYLESVQGSDYLPNIGQFANNRYNLIWGIGYLIEAAMKTAAQTYPNTKFAIVDSSSANAPQNLTCVIFKAEESSFLVGYIAALKTKTNRVGFIGGMKSVVISQFQYGYQAGVAYGAKQLGKAVAVNTQYANSFSDAAIGKAIAQNMYAKGCDIVFAAAGNVGQGVINAAKENNKYCIGADMDQSYLAPDHMLTSALKNVDKAVYRISAQIRRGENVGAQTFNLGIKDNCVGVPYTAQTRKMCGQPVLDKTKAVQKLIADGKITPPQNESQYNQYLETLK